MTPIVAGQCGRRRAAGMPREQPPVANCLPEHAVLLPAARADHDRAGRKGRPGPAAQAPHQEKVFQQRLQRKSTEFEKCFAAHEDRLIAIRQAETSHAGGVAALQQAIGQPRLVDPLAQGAVQPPRVRQTAIDLSGNVTDEITIGMQKEQHVAGGSSGARVLLDGAAWRRGEQLAAHAGRDRPRVIGAAAIDNDHFGSARLPGRIDGPADI